MILPPTPKIAEKKPTNPPKIIGNQILIRTWEIGKYSTCGRSYIFCNIFFANGEVPRGFR